MVIPPDLETALGMELYSTDVKAVGGRVKKFFEDFLVEEITPEGQVLRIEETGAGTQQAISEIQGEPKRARFIHMKVQKIGLTTMAAANILASTLNVPRHLVAYAGLKDRRAVTTQLMSIPRQSLDALLGLDSSSIMVSELRFSRTPLQIGDLWGNHFTILLRDMDASCEDAKASADSLRTALLMNYFGIQRFGATRPFTHYIGRALLKRDFEGACMDILARTTEYESKELTEARTKIGQGVLEESFLDPFPKDMTYERSVLRHLLKHPADYEGAISRVPPRILALFLHSYQSYLFNRLLSQRVKSGHSIRDPLPGDFIMQLDTTHSGRDEWLFVTERNLDERSQQVSSGEYALALAIPGYATKMTQYPQSNALRLLDFRNSKKRELDSPGGLHLVNITLPDLTAECIPEGLRLGFRLRKGSYATIVLRELMKNHPINRA
jgi:tRNA pseudouridine13 synthase